MKKTVVVLVSMFALLLSACSQLPGFGSTPAAGPTLNATSVFGTAVAKTLTAQPTLTSVSVTDTATPPIMPADSDTPMATWTAFATFTLPPNLTTTPVTATSGPVNTAAAATSTPTLATGQAVPIWTLGVRTYGTLPPEVPFNRITLINRAKAEAYISLHVDLDGSNTVMEYPVEGTMRIKAPIGSYSYVAWVGGRKMTGSFRLTAHNDITITLFKDKVVIK